jgi:cell division protein ZapB
MDEDLKALEQKLSQLVSLCSELRNENAQLRLNMHAMESDATRLKASMEKASERIESLIDSLP